jgi:hypothetical protein
MRTSGMSWARSTGSERGRFIVSGSLSMLFASVVHAPHSSVNRFSANLFVREAGWDACYYCIAQLRM